MPRPIQDQVIVITGASSGIGLTTAQQAARQGAKVVLAARNARDLERAAEALQREGHNALAVPTDVTDVAQVETLAERAIDAFGRIDTWVNNAAVGAYASFAEQPLEDFEQIVRTDFMGQVYGAKAALPYLKASHGALICVGSAESRRGVPLQAAYSAAKHAIKGFLDALRVELQHEGANVRVTLVLPSSINTPFFDKAKTQLGVKPMPLPPVYAPELAAEAILRAAAGNERDVFVGGAGKVLALGERLSPKLMDLQLRRIGFTKQRTDESKPADAPNNLYDALDDDGGTHGAFREKERSFSPYQQLTARSALSALGTAAALGLGAALVSARVGTNVLSGVLAAGSTALSGKGVLETVYKG